MDWTAQDYDSFNVIISSFICHHVKFTLIRRFFFFSSFCYFFLILVIGFGIGTLSISFIYKKKNYLFCFLFCIQVECVARERCKLMSKTGHRKQIFIRFIALSISLFWIIFTRNTHEFNRLSFIFRFFNMRANGLANEPGRANFQRHIQTNTRYALICQHGIEHIKSVNIRKSVRTACQSMHIAGK